MSKSDLTIDTIDDFIKEIEFLDIKNITVPLFSIPNWPQNADVGFQLGEASIKKDFLGRDTNEPHYDFLDCMLISCDGPAGLFKIEKHKSQVRVRIVKSGEIYFSVKHKNGDKRSFRSFVHEKEAYSSDRMQALFLFHQFKAIILTRAIEELRKGTEEHNTVSILIEKAFEPFIPYCVADILGK